VMAGTGAGVKLLAPENGSMGIGIENVGFSWTAVGGATSYSFVLSPNSDLSGALASEELSGTAYTYTGMLDYSTPYFWQVTAWKDGSELSTSDVGAFTTAAEPAPAPEPPAPAGPAPEIVIPAAQQITPNWIIAMIAVGAALAVLVIVLIVRTRRP
jgi:cellulose 1,4-beta-cellobiosidase